MRLSDHLSLETVLIGLQVPDRNTLLTRLVEVLTKQHALETPEEILRLVIERERRMSTALGAGIATPHARTDHVNSILMAAATIPMGVDFAAPDGQKVRLAVLVLSPNSNACAHLRALAAVSRLGPHPALPETFSASDPARFLAVLGGAGL